ncbi:hypothetical protein NRF20_15760 [Streptomyces sp. R-74717]|uniref:hypothetical protein n=1 Tax=Streptomyces TaxID=1883 RepID=UPI0022569266|nr:hypothetical protein [Streptomyces atratus]MCX5340955.1 hypothetical protein [Streptomyces atratus]
MRQWREGRKVAEDATEALKAAFAARGFRADRIGHLRPVVTHSGRPHVHLGTLPADMVECLAEALRRCQPPTP